MGRGRKVYGWLMESTPVYREVEKVILMLEYPQLPPPAPGSQNSVTPLKPHPSIFAKWSVLWGRSTPSTVLPALSPHSASVLGPRNAGHFPGSTPSFRVSGSNCVGA